MAVGVGVAVLPFLLLLLDVIPSVTFSSVIFFLAMLKQKDIFFF